ncbi:MAG: response regulator [Candidatus Harrisonbacteria bacterium]|nr:response regulator [Candidatus Harrisonbacteria bacterium]
MRKVSKIKKSPKHILVIEDNESLSKIIRLKLEKIGYHVDLCESAEEGLEILKKCEPSLIWLDIYLPGMSGLQFLEKIRKNKKTKNIKVAVVSVSGSNKKIEFAQKFSILDYFVKSNYKIDELIEEISKIIEIS